MKKILFLFLIAIAFASCDYSEPQPLDTKQILNFSVNSSDWKEFVDPNGLNRYYSYHFNVNEITSSVYNGGSVIAYIQLDGKMQLLPYVRHYQDSKGNLWTRTVDFDYSKGGISFYVTYSDFAPERPEDMDFRVVLMW